MIMFVKLSMVDTIPFRLRRNCLTTSECSCTFQVALLSVHSGIRTSFCHIISLLLENFDSLTYILYYLLTAFFLTIYSSSGIEGIASETSQGINFELQVKYYYS